MPHPNTPLPEAANRTYSTSPPRPGKERPIPTPAHAFWGCSTQSWQVRRDTLRDGRLLGRFFAGSRAKLREVAERLGVRHLANLAGCPAR
jgi:hypothetical protein